MFLKTNLDTEKETFFALLWLLPLIPLVAIFVFCLCYNHFSWVLLLITLSWFAVWWYIYQYVHTEICFEDSKITLKLKRRIYEVSVADILYIEEKSFLTKYFKTHEYKIYMRPNMHMPFSYLLVRNKTIQKNLSQLFPDVPIKRSVVLD